MDPQTNAHSNIVGGSAAIHGPSIQANQVQGGIHLHQPGVPAPPVPRQLLRVSAYFTGRQDDLAALTGLYRRASAETAPLVVVSGRAGIGKTTLVSQWLRGMPDEDFPNGQLYADLRGYSADGPASPGEVLGQFLRALGAASVPAELPELMALWRTITEPLRIAVMLDNVVSAAQARPLLPGGRGGLVVVTSRYRLTGLRPEGAVFHQLGPLDTDTAVELLSRVVGEERVNNEVAAAREVAMLCDGLPLAVCLASARLASRPRQRVQRMANALAQERDRLSALTVEGGETAVRTTLDESYAVLPDAAARLYRRLGVLPIGAFEPELAAAVCPVPLDEAEFLLDELVEANLVEDVGTDLYRLHDLVRLHAAERAETEARRGSDVSRNETLRRACDWCVVTASAAQRLLTPVQATLDRTPRFPPELPHPFVDGAGALEWLEARRFDLLAAVRVAREHDWPDVAWQIVDAMWPLFSRLRHYGLWIEAHELGLAAARDAGHRAAERQMLNSGAIGLSAAGRLERAIEWYATSLRAAREAGDDRDAGQALLGLGACHREAGRFPEAEEWLADAVAVWTGTGYLRGAALARIVLGEIAVEVGDLPRAVECFGRALDEMTALSETYEAARARAFLGRAHSVAGRHDEARRELRASLDVFEAAGASHWQARTWEMLGQDAARAGESAAARGHLERARVLFAAYSPDDARRLTGLLAGLGPNGPDAAGPSAG